MNWGLIALSGDCSFEVAQAGVELARDLGAAEEINVRKSESIHIGISTNVFVDDATPVLKAYYEAQPG